MKLSPDIQKTIDIIDRRIDSLCTIKNLLLREFGSDTIASMENATEQRRNLAKKEPIKIRKTRKQTLIDFLKYNGPTTRKAIHEETGIPRGTIAWLLARDIFQQYEDGKWGLKEEQLNKPEADQEAKEG